MFVDKKPVNLVSLRKCSSPCGHFFQYPLFFFLPVVQNLWLKYRWSWGISVCSGKKSKLCVHCTIPWTSSYGRSKQKWYRNTFPQENAKPLFRHFDTGWWGDNSTTSVCSHHFSVQWFLIALDSGGRDMWGGGVERERRKEGEKKEREGKKEKKWRKEGWSSFLPQYAELSKESDNQQKLEGSFPSSNMMWHHLMNKEFILFLPSQGDHPC